jgi:phytoene/squalene synthetase
MPELFAEPLRPHVHAFGRFVRLAEAVTDNNALARDEKQARLTALETALTDSDGTLWSAEADAVTKGLCHSLRETGVRVEHARHILQALRREARNHVCASWHDLMVHCQFAAAPIGRYMLELVGEDLARCTGPADALCGGLRILRQLRDCEDPTIRFNRLCIPRQFLDDAMITPQHLRAPSAKGQTRAVLDRVLDGVDHLLASAAPLPGLIQDRGLRAHSAIVLCRGRQLASRFHRRDPIGERVGLSSWQRTLCRWLGTLRSLAR